MFIYLPDIAKQIINGSGYHETTREQLQWLINRTWHFFSLRQREKGIQKKFELNPRTIAKRPKQLENLGIHFVPLLEDDSASFKLISNGKIEW